MENHTCYYLVDSDVLPEIFKKVVQAKKLLAQGKVRNLSEAARVMGISRSAYYKYKDKVYEYDRGVAGKMVTLSVTLGDEPGRLSELLNNLSSAGLNILTINQNIPVDGVAPVAISARTDELQMDISHLISLIRSMPGVVEARVLSGQ